MPDEAKENLPMKEKCTKMANLQSVTWLIALMDEWLQMDKKYKGWNDTQFWQAQETCENKKKIAYLYLPRHNLDLYES